MVFIIKVNPDSSVARFKARLIAKIYARTYGVNYSYTFSSMAKLTSISLFISIAAILAFASVGYQGCFSSYDLQEELYMEQPLDFVA